MYIEKKNPTYLQEARPQLAFETERTISGAQLENLWELQGQKMPGRNLEEASQLEFMPCQTYQNRPSIALSLSIGEHLIKDFRRQFGKILWTKPAEEKFVYISAEDVYSFFFFNLWHISHFP